MTEPTRQQKETAIKMFSLAMWGAVVSFVVLAALFYTGVIKSNQGTLIAICLLAVAVLDAFLVRFMTAKMRADLDK